MKLIAFLAVINYQFVFTLNIGNLFANLKVWNNKELHFGNAEFSTLLSWAMRLEMYIYFKLISYVNWF